MGAAVDPLLEYRHAWQRKPALRAIYADYYRRIAAWARAGATLELGGGSGNLKDHLVDIVTTDIQHAPWLDAVADAQALPFRDEGFANVVMFDVLHHIERPRRFLAEVQRVLTPGGRLIVVEPDITPLSGLFYRLFHPEPVDMGEDPLADGARTRSRNPYDANQAIPCRLFGRDRAKVEALFPRLRIVARHRLALFTYPLSGGFRPWSLVPASCVPLALRLEDLLLPVLGPLMAFRLLGVIEKQ